MRVFNRIVMILLILLTFVGALILVTHPVDVIGQVRGYLDTFEESLFNDTWYTIFVLGTTALEIVLLVLLVLELRRGRRKAVRIRTKSGAKAVLGIESVAQSLEFRIDELAGVRKVAPHIKSNGKDVSVLIDLDTSPSVNVPVLTEQVIGMCRDIVEGQLGVKIRGKVTIQVHHEPYPRGTMPPTQPIPRGTDAIATQPRIVEQPAEPEPPAAEEQISHRRFMRREQPPVAPVETIEPAPAPEPEPVVETGPAPIGDLMPLEPEEGGILAPGPTGDDARRELDELDLYDPDSRDE